MIGEEVEGCWFCSLTDIEGEMYDATSFKLITWMLLGST